MFKFKKGQKWLTAEGKVVTISEIKDFTAEFPIKTSCGLSYTLKGSYYKSSKSSNDLLSLYEDTIDGKNIKIIEIQVDDLNLVNKIIKENPLVLDDLSNISILSINKNKLNLEKFITYDIIYSVIY